MLEYYQEQRAAERERMVVTQLERRGLRDQRVLAAMRCIPREVFVPPHVAPEAYDDKALPVESGQTISQPYMVARMTELLELHHGQRVLEIGTGTGYQAAILAAMGLQVFTIERHRELLDTATRRLGELGLGDVRLRWGDGSLGWPEEAPFDGILVTAGAPQIPQALRDQLALGGRLVAPVGNDFEQTLIVLRRTAEGFDRQDVMQCRFVKLIGAEGWTEE